jgi:hypothetical protein
MSEERQDTETGAEESSSEKTSKKAKAAAGSIGEKVKSFLGSEKVRGIRPLTWLGIVVALAFFVCMFIDTVNIRWWIMLPLGAAGTLLLWKQWKSTPEEKDLEMKVTFFGLMALIALVLLRDAWLSSSLANIYDAALQSGEVLQEFQDLIGR